MSVTLRYRDNLKEGTSTPYLDIYDKGIRKREFLVHLKILLKPRNNHDKDANRQMKLLAQQALTKRSLEIQSESLDIIPAAKRTTDLVKYFTDYTNRYKKQDKRVILASLAKFEAFLNEEGIKQLTANRLTRELVINFKEYLESNLKGETPSNYFKKFKKVIESLVNSGVLNSNPAKSVTLKRNDSIVKDILTFSEIEKLYNTPITNEEIKRAFLFSCFTGLRFCDIVEIKHENIQNGYLKITQKKTSKPVVIQLHPEALKILENCNAKKGVIFNLPSHTACLKSLSVWVKNAGIQKHISWHCARHSFATAIIEHGSDVSSASSLLGHSSFAYTQRYVRVVEKLKEKAIATLPTFS